MNSLNLPKINHSALCAAIASRGEIMRGKMRAAAAAIIDDIFSRRDAAISAAIAAGKAAIAAEIAKRKL